MGTITSGVGLFSGLDFTSLVDQLMVIESRPRDKLMLRMSSIDAQRTAYMDITARISALLARVSTLTKPSFFQATTAFSSNTDVLSVSTGDGVRPGSYSFTVRSLATTHQIVSRGYTSSDTPVAAGVFTLESAAARVNRETTLEELNGFAGVQRGSFKIMDGDGEEATISIHDAQTIGDVLDRINDADIGVRAELQGETIVLKDTTEGGLGLRVREVGDGTTAHDLGFEAGNTYSAEGELQGSEIIYLAEATPLSFLNDGLGIRRAAAGGDFTIQSSDPSVNVTVKLSEIIDDTTRLERLNHARGVELGRIRITTKNGETTELDLTNAKTIGDIKNTIESNVEGVLVVMTGGRLVVSDTTDAENSDFSIQDVEGHTARDLGILETTEGTKIDGRQILHVDTLADIIAAINYGDGNRQDDDTPVIQASIDPDGKRLIITDNGDGTFPSTVFGEIEDSNSKALYDLGFQPGANGSFGAEIQGERILGGLDTVLLKTLNGGQGFTGGIISISANSVTADVDLSESETLRDAIEQINAASEQFGLGIEAGYDSTGTRLQIAPLLDDSIQISIADVDGNFAASLGIDTDGNRIQSDNLQRQYISETTRLEDLNLGNGVSPGKFTITTSNGMIGTVDLALENAETLQDVIDAINDLNISVEARINDTGDGLLIIDNNEGDGSLTIAEKGGTAARDLNILGEFEDKQADGSYEFKIDTSGGDGTLEDVVDKLNETTLASAHLINDGSSVAPYRLSITSLTSGRAGELIIDDGDTDLNFGTLTRAQDASIYLGDSSEGGILITSSSNTISDVVDGLTLTLTSTDDDPVTITVDHDVESMISVLDGLVEDYNSLLNRIDEISSFNPDTETKGILFADGTLRTVENRVFRAFTGPVPGASGLYTRLSQIGVKYADGRLTFDQEKFREAYESSPEEVNNFFTTAETGLAFQLEETLEHMTEADGLIKRRDEALQSQKDLLSDRVDRLSELLAIKRERLLREFQVMEQTLGQLQSQQNALSSMTTLLPTTSS